MQLTYTVWVESLNTRDASRGKTQNICQKLESLSLDELWSAVCNFLGVSFITSLSTLIITQPKNALIVCHLL